MFPLALHEQARPTSRCGLRRLGSDPSVECIYTTVDVAVQCNLISPWTHEPPGSELVVAALQSELKSPVSLAGLLMGN